MAEELRWEEAMLEETARSMVFPPTPDLRDRVLAGIEAPAQRAPGFGRFALAGLAALAAAALLVTVISRDAREAVADFLGLAVRGERIEVLPTPPAGATATAVPTPAGSAGDIERIATVRTRAEVAASGTHLVLPASLGEPKGYYSVFGAPSVYVVDYGDIQIWEFPYEGEYFIGKGIVGEGTVVQELQVDGHKAYWVSGGLRVVTVHGPAGPIVGTQRSISANALVWSADGLYRRIEGAGTLEEALKLAAEMR